MQKTLSVRDICLLTLVAFIWGFNFVVIKWGLEGLPPVLFNALRFAVVIPCLIWVPFPKIPIATLSALGILFGVLLFGLMFVGMAIGFPAGLSSLVVQMQVFFTIILGSFLLGEHVSTVRWGALLLGFAGLCLIGLDILSVRQHSVPQSLFLAGFVCILGSAVCWAGTNILLKRQQQADLVHVMMWMCLIPPLPLLIISLIWEGPALIWQALSDIKVSSIGAILYGGLVSTAFAYGIWAAMLKKYATNIVTPFALLVPVFGFGSAILLLDERMHFWQWIAAFLIFAALGLNIFVSWLHAKSYNRSQ